MTDILKSIEEFLNNNMLLGNVSIFGFSMAYIIKSIISSLVNKAKNKVQEVCVKNEVTKDDLEDINKSIKVIQKVLKTAFVNSKLDTSVKLNIEETIEGKEVVKVESVPVVAPVETTKSVVEKLESELK